VISKVHVRKLLQIKLLQKAIYGRLSRRRHSCAGGRRRVPRGSAASQTLSVIVVFGNLGSRSRPRKGKRLRSLGLCALCRKKAFESSLFSGRGSSGRSPSPSIGMNQSRSSSQPECSNVPTRSSHPRNPKPFPFLGLVNRLRIGRAGPVLEVRNSPTIYIAFDIPANSENLLGSPFRVRRKPLERFFENSVPRSSPD
jgi:hypothetical protein